MDEGRWLRPERRQAWRGFWRVLALCWLVGLVDALIKSCLPTRLGSFPPVSSLFLYGVWFPILFVGFRLAYWSAHRSLAWQVDPAGVVIWRRGAVAHSYAWSEICGLRPKGFDSVRIQTADEWREHLMRIVPFDDVLWFREYAHARMIEHPDAATTADPIEGGG